jgi:predicted O-methyltransferase YrrM
VADIYVEMTEPLHDYVVEHSEGRDELLDRLAEESDREAGDLAEMRTSPEQASLLGLLARSIGARRALEVGTFTGYGSISIARALPEDGELITCDVSEQWTAIARRYWEQAGLADRIDLRLGPALETLRGLPDDEPFDFAYVDADKGGYPDYYEECVRLVRPGGLIGIDNVLYSGHVADDGIEPQWRDSLAAIKQTNDRVLADGRVLSVIVGIRDGLTLALKLA